MCIEICAGNSKLLECESFRWYEHDTYCHISILASSSSSLHARYTISDVIRISTTLVKKTLYGTWKSVHSYSDILNFCPSYVFLLPLPPHMCLWVSTCCRRWCDKRYSCVSYSRCPAAPDPDSAAVSSSGTVPRLDSTLRIPPRSGG